MNKQRIPVRLTQGDKEFYLNLDDGTDVLGRIAGYRKLAHAAGVKILTPPTLRYNNETRSNPHVIRDGGKLVEVVSRKISFGHDHHGEQIAVDQTIFFNPLNYLAKKLIDMSLKYPNIAKMANKDAIPAKDIKGGFFISVADSGVSNVGVFVPNLAHPELENVWSDYNDSVLYAERNAQTMCERSALQKHPAIPQLSTNMLFDEGQGLHAEVYHWEMSPEESSRFEAMALKIGLGESVEVKRTVSVDELTEGK